MGDVDTSTEAVLALAAAATPGPWAPYYTVHVDPFVVPEGDGPGGAIANVSTAPPDYGRANCEWLGRAPGIALALVAERDEARAENGRLRAENERLRVVLAANTAYEDTPCRFDHHGDCQEHLRGDIDGRCAVAVARELLAGVEAPAAGTDRGARRLEDVLDEVESAAVAGASVCPLGECDHPWGAHDWLDRSTPLCCVEGCPCGKAPAAGTDGGACAKCGGSRYIAVRGLDGAEGEVERCPACTDGDA